MGSCARHFGNFSTVGGKKTGLTHLHIGLDYIIYTVAGTNGFCAEAFSDPFAFIVGCPRAARLNVLFDVVVGPVMS